MPVRATLSGAIELLVPHSERTGALRFGDQRALALAGALCLVVNTVTGFTNRSLRGQAVGVLGKNHGSTQMSCELRRSRLQGWSSKREPTPIPPLQRGSESPFLTTSCTLACSVRSSTPTNPVHVSSFAGLSPHVEHVLGDYVTNARLGATA